MTNGHLGLREIPNFDHASALHFLRLHVAGVLHLMQVNKYMYAFRPKGMNAIDVMVLIFCEITKQVIKYIIISKSHTFNV